MIQAPDLPFFIAFLVGLLVLAGSLICFVGVLGLVRMNSFYERVHSPALGATLGAGAMLVASMLCISTLQSRPVIHEVLIALFLTITTPVTLVLLGRAALYRDRAEGTPGVPPSAESRDAAGAQRPASAVPPSADETAADR